MKLVKVRWLVLMPIACGSEPLDVEIQSAPTAARSPLYWAQESKIVPATSVANDKFGYSVAMTVDTLLVGAPGDNSWGADSGAAYVFVRSGATWAQQQKLVPSGIAPGDEVGMEVDLEANTAVIGGRRYGTAGAVFVYVRSGATWSLQQTIEPSGATAFADCGSAVALSGDTLLIGCPQDDSPVVNGGSTYIYVRSGVTWTEQQKIAPPAGSFFFGRRADLSLNTAFIGQAFVFNRSGSSWSQTNSFTAPMGMGWTQPAADGDTLAIVSSAPTCFPCTPPESLVHLYERDGAIPTQFNAQTPLTDLGIWAWGDVALRGDVLAVGPIGGGSVYVWERSGGTWALQRQIPSPNGGANDSFGEEGISIHSGRLGIGAPGDRGNGSGYGFTNGSGAVFVYVALPFVAQGASCTEDAACGVNGHCVDGVCCDTACGGNSTTDCFACSVAAGATTNGTCAPLANGASCTDGEFCNGTETCTSGVCGGSTGDPCAANVGDNDTNCMESCSEGFDACIAYDPVGSPCADDGLYCNGTESCSGLGLCRSSGNPCAANVGDADTDCSESCDEGADTCTANDPDASACADGLYCNGSDTCVGGTCVPSNVDPCAANIGDADNDCSESCNEPTDNCVANDPDGSTCRDSLFCNGTETCTAGVCSNPSGDPCASRVGDADNDCSESCNEATDQCTANDPSGSACNDGAFCNGTETCNTSGVCGSPSGVPCSANVGDADTDCSESCNEAADQCTAIDPNGSACSDGLFCTGADTCQGGVCTTGTNPCAANVGDADADCSESCDEGADTCTANDPDASACTDGLYCNGSDTCAGGTSVPSNVDPCAANIGDADSDCSESCNESSDSCTATDADGSSCSDALFCNGTETCSAGSCGASTGDPCAANLDDADTDCSESCDEAAAACTAGDPDTSSCTDGLFCTGAESCQSGACVSAGDPCAANLGDADADCSESCDEAAGTCTAADTDASSCFDGDLCNESTCQAGTCVGTPLPCTSGACQGVASCNPSTGACEAETLADGTDCVDELGTAGICTAGECLPEELHQGGDPTGNVESVGCSCEASSGGNAALWVLALAAVAVVRRSPRRRS